MPVSQQHIGPDTRMGANLVDGGATFRTWAPSARDVYVVTDAGSTASWSSWTPNPSARLVERDDGTWAGFVPNIRDGAPYLFWIRGPVDGKGSEGFKRDPYARELAASPAYPNGPCLVRDPRAYPWHDGGWRPPAFNDLIIYQLHIGTFWAADAQGNDRRRSRYGTFLDVVERIPHLQALGVNAVQLLPIQEFNGDTGLGYAGLDFFSPEMEYEVEDPAELSRYLGTVNDLLGRKGLPPLSPADIAAGTSQLMCLVDLCHVHGIAVIFDIVYNHAGGGFDERSLNFYNRYPDNGDGETNKNNLYFGNGGHAGGFIFNYACGGVRRFLIDNAKFFLEEYRIDGVRYDHVIVIRESGGDGFCRELAREFRKTRPEAIQIAEYWSWDRAYPVTPQPDGFGFDAALDDRLRIALRTVLRQIAGGAGVHAELDRVRDALYRPQAYPAAWKAVQHLENHDIVLWDVWSNPPRERELRIPALAHYADRRSWYARSRSRAATTLLLTAPGIPLLFMGQEFLEDKPWSDDSRNWPQFLIWWDGLQSDGAMKDFLQFMTDLIRLRRSRPALRGEGVRVPQVHEQDRIIVMHRWVEGEGRDMMVVASFSESTRDGYSVEMPWPGLWHEVFNSDYYDHFPNPWVAGNGGSVVADGPAGRVYPHTARLRIPANGALVLAREA